MGGGGPISPIGAAGRASQYKGGMTTSVMFIAVVAASGGLLFGYDLMRDRAGQWCGVSGTPRPVWGPGGTGITVHAARPPPTPPPTS